MQPLRLGTLALPLGYSGSCPLGKDRDSQHRAGPRKAAQRAPDRRIALDHHPRRKMPPLAATSARGRTIVRRVQLLYERPIVSVSIFFCCPCLRHAIHPALLGRGAGSPHLQTGEDTASLPALWEQDLQSFWFVKVPSLLLLLLLLAPSAVAWEQPGPRRNATLPSASHGWSLLLESPSGWGTTGDAFIVRGQPVDNTCHKWKTCSAMPAPFLHAAGECFRRKLARAGFAGHTRGRARSAP